MLEKEIVILEPLLKLVKRSGAGVLVIDDTTNPKYGLKQWTRKLKIVGTSGYEHGYKILLFLWECQLGRIPLGFPPRGCFAMHCGTKEPSRLMI